MPRIRSALERATLIVAVCLPLTGCSLLARVIGSSESPVVELHASRVESVSLSTTQLVFELLLHNPNVYALTARAFQYRLTVNQTLVADGATNVTVTVPAKGSASAHLPIGVQMERLSNAAQGAMVLGEIPFDLDVWLAVDSWLRRREIHLLASSVLRLNLPLGLACDGAIAFPGVGWQGWSDLHHEESFSAWDSISQKSTRQSLPILPTANALSLDGGASTGGNSTCARGASPTS